MENDEVTLENFKTRLCRREDVLGADLILVMSEEHRKFVSELCAPAKDRIIILDIADPVGMSIDFYDRSYRAIKEKLSRIWSEIVS